MPSDYNEILSRLVSPIRFKSKKELFMRLSSPLHVDGGRKLFWLDRFTGKKCYMLSARELSIAWGHNPLAWSWTPLLPSRFPEVVELVTTWWLEIKGRINSHMLSPNTIYMSYLIVRFSNRAYGLDTLPSVVTVESNHHQQSVGTVYLRPEAKISLWDHLGFFKLIGLPRSRGYIGENKGISCERADGWFEIELGEFYNCGNDGVVRMSLRETEGAHLKSGLIVEGTDRKSVV